MKKSTKKRKMLKAPKLVQKLLKCGSEKPDPKPMNIPVGFKKPQNLKEQIHQMIKNERLIHEMEAAGMETFEDADDFDIGDDYDPTSPYEMDFDQEQYSHHNDNTMQEEQPISKPEKPESLDSEKPQSGEGDQSEES
jgi:hypothetical protein